ncbi:hypothetical protein EmuJ_000895800 [Echinococcus multilocularis]|uniref:Uncharacterized protein n=1 Tax=Echinococcus multilocularis TaxID=6211 RepID=A0A068Y950_ECHMU|nr:hypothetical protein EmuJ_000895800 [Echinococcus multilocularis]
MHLLHPTERHHGLSGAKMEGKGQGGRKRGKVVDEEDEEAAVVIVAAKPSAHLHARAHAHANLGAHKRVPATTLKEAYQPPLGLSPSSSSSSSSFAIPRFVPSNFGSSVN